MSSSPIESAYNRQVAISKLISGGVISSVVIENLVSNGLAVRDEAVMWDFKIILPVLNSDYANDHIRKMHECKMAEIVKDAVAFFNTYGGYIIAGIDDKNRELVGFSDEFDAADLNKKIQGSTGVSIETIYRVLEITISDKTIKFGLLFIPKRPSDQRPIQFKKNAPENDRGRRAYLQNEFYMRERDNCRPAVSVDDLEFIFGRRHQQAEEIRIRALDHNLPPRDFDLINLIGRDTELSQLYSWLPDAFSPIKILCGVGGVGKTSIAYTFAERIIYQSPGYIDKLIWLGAKEIGFGPLSGREFKLPRSDFNDIDQLLVQLLLQTGCPVDQIPDAPSREELLNLSQQHLLGYSYLLVIDNVDSLSDEEQQQIFIIFMQLCSVSKAKAIITARRNLGASRAIYTEVEGLDYKAFQAFMVEKCTFLRIIPPIRTNSKEMKDLFDASGGSPLFALSILRLVILGDSFRDALRNWRGGDGEEVRQAAFEREVGRLNAIECKTLLVLCYTGQASASEISNFTNSTRHETQKALETLQSFSMTILDHSLPGSVSFRVPATLTLVASLVERRVPDWKELKNLCAQFVKLRDRQEPYIADIVVRTIGFLNDKNPSEALITVGSAINVLPQNQDLYCLLGRVYLYMDDTRAEDAYQKSFDFGCRKRELLDGWIESKQRREDWRGIISVASVGEREHKALRYYVAHYHAEMMLGDQLSKVGKYNEAEEKYDNAIKEIVKIQRMHPQHPDARSIRELKNGLIFRWLGAVRMGTRQHSGWQARYFGACHRAVVVYRTSNDNVLKNSLVVLNEWVDRIASRKSVSDTAKSQIDQAVTRLDGMVSEISKRESLDETRRLRFVEDAKRVRGALLEISKTK